MTQEEEVFQPRPSRNAYHYCYCYCYYCRYLLLFNLIQCTIQSVLRVGSAGDTNVPVDGMSSAVRIRMIKKHPHFCCYLNSLAESANARLVRTYANDIYHIRRRWKPASCGSAEPTDKGAVKIEGMNQGKEGWTLWDQSDCLLILIMFDRHTSTQKKRKKKGKYRYIVVPPGVSRNSFAAATGTVHGLLLFPTDS